MELTAAFVYLEYGDPIPIVMPGLDPGIHPNEKRLASAMDCRAKARR
jgi:hypothetical protein